MSAEKKIAEPLEVLNLVMRKQFAQEILEGKKRVEFRAYSEHYSSRLYDKEVLQYMQLHKDEPEIIDQCDPLREVQSIHFHNYDNTWFLDCECELNDIVAVTDEDVQYLNEEYDCHDLDEQLTQLKAIGEDNRPLYYYFVLGRIVKTNLH